MAILMIVASHIPKVFGALDFGGRLFAPWGGVGVCIFLIISGYGINESFKNKGLEGYWLRKLVRVFVPYVLLTSIRLGFNLAGEQGVTALLDILCLRTRLWFVSYILYMYAAYYVGSRWFPEHRIVFLLAVGVVLLLMMKKDCEGEQSFSFLIGVAVSQYRSAIILFAMRNRTRLYCFLLATACAFFLLKQLPGVRGSSCYVLVNIVQMLYKVPIAIAVILSTSQALWLQGNHFLAFCGRISYELYLVHIVCSSRWHGSLFLATVGD